MFDVTIFTALGWERRAVTEALRTLEPSGPTGALAVEMESGALAAAARARGIPFAALRVVLDGAGEALPAELGVIDEATGEVRAGRALAAMALHPRLWPAAARLARRQRSAARRLGAIMAALEVEAIAAPPEAATAAGI